MDQKPGERACNLAMALVVAGTLRDLEGDEDPPHLLLREKLEADAAWQAFVGEEGAMAKFDAEQSGGCAGPSRRGGITVNDFAGFGGGYAGRNLLRDAHEPRCSGGHHPGARVVRCFARS